MNKVVLFGNEARQKLKNGVDLIAGAIKVTLGPRGRNVIHGFWYGFPVCTKDGVTVARQVECKDPIEQLGLLLIRQVSQKTADDAGDGTTTAAVLAQAIFTEGLKVLGTGANPILIKRGIDLATQDAVKFIKEHTIKDPSDEHLLKIANISANNDPIIGQLIFDAIKKAGKDGVITIEDNYKDMTTYIETIEGMQLNEGYLSPYFVTDPIKMEAVYQNPYILIADYEITHIQPLMRAFELAVGQEKRPLVIIANNITGQALSTLVMNKHKGGVPILACKAPYFGDNRLEQLQDLAILTGGKVVSPTSGVEFDKIELDDLGQVERIVATKSYTTFTGGKGAKEDIDARIGVLQGLIEKTESDYDKAKYQERLAKLTSGVAVIKVGASTEVECKEKKMRIEDALCASRAACEEGIIAGGGVALLRAAKFLEQGEKRQDEEEIGRKIVIKALQEPIKQIAFNSGLDGSEIIAEIIGGRKDPLIFIDKGAFKDEEITNITPGKIVHIDQPATIRFKEDDNSINYGYDFLNNKYGDMIEMGVIDPAKVVRLTLENAASVASMLLTTDCVIAEQEKEEVGRTPAPRSE